MWEDCSQYLLKKNYLADHYEICSLSCNEIFQSKERIKIHQRIYANKNATIMILDGVGPVEQTLPKLAPALCEKTATKKNYI